MRRDKKTRTVAGNPAVHHELKWRYVQHLMDKHVPHFPMGTITIIVLLLLLTWAGVWAAMALLDRLSWT